MKTPFHGVGRSSASTITMAALWLPRTSPPAASAASSARSRRSAKGSSSVQGGNVGGSERLPDLVTFEQVAVGGEAVADDVATGQDAVRSGMRGCASLRVHDAELADLRMLVARHQRGDHAVGAPAVA